MYMKPLLAVLIDMGILKNANLPQSKVTCAAVSCEAIHLVSRLKSFGIDTIKIKGTTSVLPGLASHADLHILHLGGSEIWISQEQLDNKAIFEHYGFKLHILPSKLEKNYPNDVPLNAAIVGDNVFLNTKSVCKEINFTCKKIIPVNQGYSKCSTCVVNSNAIITDDESIHKAATENQIDSLLVQKGDIILKSMNYGFIGGCCGLIDKDLMLFNGNLKSHRNYNEINSFLSNYKIKVLSVGDYPLTDIGGILPLLEK